MRIFASAIWAALVALFMSVSSDAGLTSTARSPILKAPRSLVGRASSRVLCLPWPGGSGILRDGDFSEATDPGGGQSFGPGQKFAKGWSVTQGTVDFYGADDRFWREPNNVCSIDLDGSPGVGGLRHRRFQTTPGVKYTVSFVLSGNGARGPVIKKLLVKAAGQRAVFMWNISNGNDAQHGVFQQESWQFTATDLSTQLELISLDSQAHGQAFCGPIVAAVSVAPS